MIAKVKAETVAIANNGRGAKLPAGRYNVVHLDGVDETEMLYIEGPDNGALMCVDRHDITISFEEA